MNTSIASKIPLEILGEIFFYLIDGPISNIHGNNFPWAINQVCKSWRFAFVTYPQLWTWIKINMDTTYEQDLNGVNRCFALCLERSRNCSLNISLRLPIDEYYDEDGPYALVWDTFLSCSRRWRTVHLENLFEIQFIALNSCMGATPRLESLTIHGLMDTIECSNFTGFQIAPNLTRFTLVHPIAVVAIQKWTFPWTQLTSLTLKFEELDGVDQLSVLFEQLQNIEELHLVLDGDGPEIEPRDVAHKNFALPQCLKRLRILQLCCIEALDLITAPSLSELYLKGSDFFYPLTGDGEPNEELVEEIFSNFIQRSSCKIRKLTLSNFSDHPFTPHVQFFTRVEELCLANALSWLGYLLSPNQFPALRVLDCTNRPIHNRYFITTLLEILESRNSWPKSSAAPLAKVISRPVPKGGEEALAPVMPTNWAAFEKLVRNGVCCEFDLTNQIWSGWDWRRQGSPSTVPDTAIVPPGPSALSSIQNIVIPTNFMLSNTLDDFDPNIFRNDGDINFERDFGQWFNDGDLF